MESPINILYIKKLEEDTNQKILDVQKKADDTNQKQIDTDKQLELDKRVEVANAFIMGVKRGIFFFRGGR